ncbi:hypothetical protein QCA50_012668 [Cerrena zonata]|uniref:Uncharacterized protein n=1 Tax=Cerrena zonata TaxID=2478898 RepID=A0AAW0FY47_9APHY
MPVLQEYYCDCERYCQGICRKVNKNTYTKHREYWKQTFSCPFNDFLSALQPGTSSQGQGVSGSQILKQTAQVFPDSSSSKHCREDAIVVSQFAPHEIATPPKSIFMRPISQDGNLGLYPESELTPLPSSPDHRNIPLINLTTEDDNEDNSENATTHPHNVGVNGIDQLFKCEIPQPTLEELKLTKAFIDKLKTATLENSKFSAETIKQLRNPPNEDLPDLSDPFLCLSINLYLATENASESTYDKVCDAVCYCFLIHSDKILSLDQVKRRIAEFTGIYPIQEDMCINSCLAFTGPFKHLDSCPTYYEPRYDPKCLAASQGKDKIPHQTFSTFLIASQVQALMQSSKSALEM